MPAIIPAMNTTWFWFDKKNRRALHGTPLDVMRKFELLSSLCHEMNGIEIFLFPKNIESPVPFTNSFYRKFSKLNYKSVHIGDPNSGFLYNTPAIAEKLRILATILDRLETEILVLHAHHFAIQRSRIRDLLSTVLPNVTVCIENNGFDNEWGGSIEGLTEILLDCPNFKFCLDVAHVKDFADKYRMREFCSNELLFSRIHEIHYSYSTYHCQTDPYTSRGFPGYGPYHALFSVLGKSPSAETKDFIKKYPVIIEGILPKEDTSFNFLKQEAEILKQ